MRKKIRIKIPKLAYEVINKDVEYFNLKKETLYNIIIKELGFEKFTEIGYDIFSLDEKREVYFNLNEINTELVPKMIAFHLLESDIDMIIKIFITYANLHPAVRERVVYKNLFLRVEQAIKDKKNIKIYFNKEIIDILLLALERDGKTGYNFLKSKHGKDFYLYEMKHIEFVS